MMLLNRDAQVNVLQGAMRNLLPYASPIDNVRFAQRGALLAALAKAIHGARERGLVTAQRAVAADAAAIGEASDVPHQFP